MNFEDLVHKNMSEEEINVPAEGVKETTMVTVVWTDVVYAVENLIQSDKREPKGQAQRGRLRERV